MNGQIDCAPLPTTPPPTPTPPLICTCNGVCGCVPAPTCDDFDFQEDAQAAYDARRFSLPDIAAILDEDGDGIACEMLPRRQLPPTGTGPDGSPPSVVAWLIVGLTAIGLAGAAAIVARAGYKRPERITYYRDKLGLPCYLRPNPNHPSTRLYYSDEAMMLKWSLGRVQVELEDWRAKRKEKEAEKRMQLALSKPVPPRPG